MLVYVMLCCDMLVCYCGLGNSVLCYGVIRYATPWFDMVRYTTLCHIKVYCGAVDHGVPCYGLIDYVRLVYDVSC